MTTNTPFEYTSADSVVTEEVTPEVVADVVIDDVVEQVVEQTVVAEEALEPAVAEVTVETDLAAEVEAVEVEAPLDPVAEFMESMKTKEGNDLITLERLARRICVEQKGSIVIPAFSVDRTQEIISLMFSK